MQPEVLGWAVVAAVPAVGELGPPTAEWPVGGQALGTRSIHSSVHTLTHTLFHSLSDGFSSLLLCGLSTRLF